MNVLDVFKSVINLFIYYWNIDIAIGTHNVKVGAFVIFAGIATIIIKLVKGMAE